MKDISAVIPALPKNRHHSEGDLAKFGNVSLLEWKISQLKDIFTAEDIYVATYDEQIKEIAEKENVGILTRERDSSISSVLSDCLSDVKSSHILWANPTSPFLSGKHYGQMMERYINDQNCDSLISVSELKEYCFFKNEPINFNYLDVPSRSSIEPINVCTNGCYIFRKDLAIKTKSLIGKVPLEYPVDKLASVEIKDILSYSISINLMSIYFENELE